MNTDTHISLFYILWLRIAEHSFMWECSVVKAQNIMIEFMGMQCGNRLYYFCVWNNLVDVVVFDLSVQFLHEPPRCSTCVGFLLAIWPCVSICLMKCGRIICCCSMICVSAVFIRKEKELLSHVLRNDVITTIGFRLQFTLLRLINCSDTN